ncbi:hypothetical protein U27_07008 [Candidatus Vecturithrix granuli]|uniref:Poly-gamma-glutamate system protein n=1 Tax=Vecturithrix granuli TaxID=1499967 RepID=A0A081C616_VECG1|nr:hypothetical protein U27_07008 [Candidatus Vecturithrix granuli]
MFHSWIKSRMPAWYLAIIVIIGLAGLYLLETTKVEHKYRAYETQIAAAQLMHTCLQETRQYRLSLGISLDTTLDPNETGIIGEEYTDLTTTLGNLEAKRTATNPAFAALLVKFFTEADLQTGDVVAINASGSFPMLILATLSAVKVMNLSPLLIYSFGASMYGANIPGFTFLDMLVHLRSKGLLPYQPLAVSLGGEDDRADGLFDPNSKAVFLQLAQSAGAPLIQEEELAESIRERQQLYQRAAGGNPLACFVNIGGTSAGYGITTASLKFPNGLVLSFPSDLPESPVRGLIFDYAAQGIPVIHLLNIRELAASHGLPIDPVPLPAIGEGGVYYHTAYRRGSILGVLFVIFLLIGAGKMYALSLAQKPGL